jgi:hypothetical protein
MTCWDVSKIIRFNSSSPCKDETSKPKASAALGSSPHEQKPCQGETRERGTSGQLKAMHDVKVLRCLALPGLGLLGVGYPELRFAPLWALMPRPYRTKND